MSRRRIADIEKMKDSIRHISATCISISEDIGNESPQMTGCLSEVGRLAYEMTRMLDRYLSAPEGKGGKL